MGNNFISHFTSSRSDVTPLPIDDNDGDDGAIQNAPVETEAQVESLTDKQYVAWEIDVSNWRPRGKGNKATRGRGVKTSYLLEKHDNAVVGGATEVISDETKSELVKVTLPTMKSELKMAQCYDDMKEKKVLDLRRW